MIDPDVKAGRMIAIDVEDLYSEQIRDLLLLIESTANASCVSESQRLSMVDHTFRPQKGRHLKLRLLDEVLLLELQDRFPSNPTFDGFMDDPDHFIVRGGRPSGRIDEIRYARQRPVVHCSVGAEDLEQSFDLHTFVKDDGEVLHVEQDLINGVTSVWWGFALDPLSVHPI